MSKKQLILTSFLAVIPAVGLIAALVIGAIGGVAQTPGMWGLFGATLLMSIGALASPVVTFLLIPGAEDTEEATTEPDGDEETQDSDANLEVDEFADADDIEDGEDLEIQEDYNSAETEVASSDEMDDFDDDDDFQAGDDVEVDFEEFDDDEDFV
ncbi:MAG: hypothetical protein MK110_06230 [Fuerstiella sp.]|nr:hypothetical protein [Fuerstiella sp.]